MKNAREGAASESGLNAFSWDVGPADVSPRAFPTGTFLHGRFVIYVSSVTSSPPAPP